MVTTIRVVSGTDTLEAEGLVFESMHISHMRAGCQSKGCIISVCLVRVKEGEMMCIIKPRSHKAIKAKGSGARHRRLSKGWAGMMLGKSDITVGEGGGISQVLGIE
jgi:hypothetical protein